MNYSRNTDGSVAHVSGTGQRELYHVYDVSGSNLRETVKLGDNQTTLSQSITNGFDELITEAVASVSGFIYTRSEYNAKGQLTKQYQDAGWNTTPTAATLFEYDTMGNVSKKTLALAEAPDETNSPTEVYAYGAESLEDGIYSVLTRTRFNAAGSPLISLQKQMISSLSSSIESKSISVSERNLTSAQWSVYNAATKRTRYTSLPSSDITAEAVTVDGFTLSQTDNAGVTTTNTRSYTANGMIHSRTDGRGNTSTTVTDIAGRTLTVTDAAGNTTSTTYAPAHDLPATVTDAQGNTSCYRYDERGRKVAEWGTGIQPALFAYDAADRMTSLTTFRASTETVSTDPVNRTDGDVTTWSYHDTSGMEIRKSYADGSSVTRTYDAYNRVLTETDARGKVKTHTYEHARGLLLGTSYNDSTTPRSYTYNHLGQLTQVTDAAGTRTLSYNAYGEQESDSLVVDSVTHLITENRDEQGRSSGYTYAKNASVQQTATTDYGSDGRISSAGFIHGGAQKMFGYTYLPGTHLLQTLTKPNNMSLTLSYEDKRDLLTGMSYKRGNTGVASRTYTYDAAGRPITRNTARNGTTVNDSFGYNTRSELTAATVNNGTYSYNYDNIGNRNTAQEITEEVTNYTANNLNQYTAIGDFAPTYDAAGNQTLVKTTTGIWTVAYDAENRPVSFTNAETNTVIECAYDYMGRRATKKVTVNGSVTLHRRYLYRGYLQIACCDLTRSNHPALWLITWDPTQPIATRPLAIQKDGTWYTYGWDLTKNICEVYGINGYIRTTYTYTPYGAVTISGDVTQPIQWSSEFHDDELALVYYNYRHYNPTDGRWLGRDRFEELESINLYRFINNKLYITDYLGDTDFYQTCTNILREEYDNFVLERVEELQNKFNEETWNLVAEDLKKWLNGEQPSSTTYMESDPRTQVIMNSYIGNRLKELFMQKNKNAKLCNDWIGMKNISIKLPNMFTVFNLILSSIFLKDPFIGLTEQSKIEIRRFIISIFKGSTAFVGSISANIYVTKQREGNKDYILATYHVYNTVSKQSYYLRQPDVITDFIFNSNLKDWEQNYFWREKYDCIDMFIDCIDPCMYMHMAPGNPFSPLM